MEIFSLRADEILIVADGKNDIELFIPGIKSIVVANAHPDIKTLAQNTD